MEKEWVDGFLYVDVLVVATLVFLDWVLGKERRKKIREGVGDWYLYLEESTYGKLLSDDAEKIRGHFTCFFGDTFLSKRRIITSILVSMALTVSFSVVIHLLLGMVILFYLNLGCLLLQRYFRML